MHTKWLMLKVLVLSMGVDSTPVAERLSFSDRIAFACTHKPTLSFCSPNKEPSIHVTANDRIAPQHPEALRRRSDVPTPKRRVRWVFVPNSGDSRFWDDLAKSARTTPKTKNEPLLIIPPEPFHSKSRESAPSRALQSRTFPVLPSDAAYGA
ncbi:hypothetical protein PRIPAC_82173, partial [Pristionchus pacificus]